MSKANILSVLLSVTSLSCGDDGGNSASSQCKRFVDAYCTRSVSCESTDSKSECMQLVEAALPGDGGCSSARAIRDEAEFDSCVAQILGSSCDELDSLPPECEGQILF